MMPSFKIIGLPVLGKLIFEGVFHIWAWRPSWSCDLDHLYKLFPFPRMFHMKFCFDWSSGFDKMIFENGGYFYVYSPGAEADNALGSNCFH